MKKFWIAIVGVALACGTALYAEDVVKAVSGVVKSVDKTSKTMVVKTKDGTEQTIKWTDKTTDEGAKGVSDASKATYDGAKEGTAVTVKYTEKGGEKTAVAVKSAAKATADATKKAADKTADAVK
jgi:hypothetical protein